MAQAARLSLRMQKELKLLLTDPPPGATFPSLSADADIASLSSIDAQIEGPEGTVYSRGIFKIKIQIPERYPFQPPIVTFGTPIYHPNIDNGGRICLDILNLPPKGSWQPSLNVSTVLTSIRLLLAEPNPDDGLMCEASREYKYNRQDFELKARSMTEKFANGGAGESSCNNQCIQPTPKPSMTESKDLHKDIKDDGSVGDERPCGPSTMLSIGPSGSISNGASKFEANGMPKQPFYAFGSENVIGDKGKRKEVTGGIEDCNSGCSKIRGTRRKLSLASSGQLQKDHDDNKENIDPNCPLFCPPQAISVALSSSVLQATTNRDKQSHRYQNGLKHFQKQPRGLPASCQVSDGKDEKILPTNQPRSDAMKPEKGSPVLMSSGHKNVQAKEIVKDRTEKAPTGTKSATSSFVGKKNLSLGLKAASHRSTLLKPKSTRNKTELLPLQENSCYSRILTSNNFSMEKSKCLPVQANDKHNEKQQSDNKQNRKMGKEMKQQERELEEEEFPVPEATIVLDSEESEEEEPRSSRLRLSLGRKGIGKPRAKT